MGNEHLLLWDFDNTLAWRDGLWSGAVCAALRERGVDPVLRADPGSAIAGVRRIKDFGLVFESHLPETCRLPSHPVRRGVKATRRTADDGSLFTVGGINGGMATVLPITDTDGVAIPMEDRSPTAITVMFASVAVAWVPGA